VTCFSSFLLSLFIKKEEEEEEETSMLIGFDGDEPSKCVLSCTYEGL